MSLNGLYRIKVVFISMAVWAFILGAFPSGGFCIPVGSQDNIESRTSRDRDIEAISRLLEADIVKNKLRKLGLSENEVMARVERLGDSELHNLALRVNKIHAGGDAGGVALAILLVVLIVVAILYFTDRAIKIEKKR